MARILLTLLVVILCLNALTFLMVAFDEPAATGAAAGGDASGDALKKIEASVQSISTQVAGIKRKVDDLARLKSTISGLSRKLDDTARKIERTLENALAPPPEELDEEEADAEAVADETVETEEN